jgi:hypothetical protein
MLGDDADWNAETWAMRADIIEPLAQMLEELLRLVLAASRWRRCGLATDRSRSSTSRQPI